MVNGLVPASARRDILGVSLRIPTANAVQRLVESAAKDGVTISIFLPAGGYRSLFTQAQMKMERNRKKYGISPTFNLAMLSAPGKSPHGDGYAVDFRSSDGGKWLHEHADYFGFSWPLGDADPAHWVHDGHTQGQGFGLSKDEIKKVAQWLHMMNYSTSSTRRTGKRTREYIRGVQRWAKHAISPSISVTGKRSSYTNDYESKLLWRIKNSSKA